ncbi:hypothetical protein D3C72_1030250 [compost metagenome]
MNTFSRPENSGLKPAPSSSRAAMRPWAVTVPLVGVSVPATICRIVLLPEPFTPTSPVVVPFSTLRLTSLSAQNASWCGLRSTISLSRSTGLRYIWNFFDTLSRVMMLIYSTSANACLVRMNAM